MDIKGYTRLGLDRPDSHWGSPLRFLTFNRRSHARYSHERLIVKWQELPDPIYSQEVTLFFFLGQGLVSRVHSTGAALETTVNIPARHRKKLCPS